MTLQVEPEVLSFHRPFTFDVVQCDLSIKNNSKTDPLVFKIKTTAPKTYCVRPNCGVVGMGETKTIQGKQLNESHIF
jgi:hypothetical protein